MSSKFCYYFLKVSTCIVALLHFLQTVATCVGLVFLIAGSDYKNVIGIVVSLWVPIILSSVVNGILLTNGIFQNKTQYVLLYLVFGCPTWVLTTLLVVMYLGISYEYEFFVFSVTLVVMGLFQLCVYKFYKYMVANNDTFTTPENEMNGEVDFGLTEFK